MTTKAGSGPASLVREIVAVTAFGALFLAGNHSGTERSSAGFSPLVLDWPVALGGAAYAGPATTETRASRLAVHPLSVPAGTVEALTR